MRARCRSLSLGLVALFLLVCDVAGQYDVGDSWGDSVSVSLGSSSTGPRSPWMDGDQTSDLGGDRLPPPDTSQVETFSTDIVVSARSTGVRLGYMLAAGDYVNLAVVGSEASTWSFDCRQSSMVSNADGAFWSGSRYGALKARFDSSLGSSAFYVTARPTRLHVLEAGWITFFAEDSPLEDNCGSLSIRVEVNFQDVGASWLPIREISSSYPGEVWAWGMEMPVRASTLSSSGSFWGSDASTAGDTWDYRGGKSATPETSSGLGLSRAITTAVAVAGAIVALLLLVALLVACYRAWAARNQANSVADPSATAAQAAAAAALTTHCAALRQEMVKRLVREVALMLASTQRDAPGGVSQHERSQYAAFLESVFDFALQSTDCPPIVLLAHRNPAIISPVDFHLFVASGVKAVVLEQEAAYLAAVRAQRPREEAHIELDSIAQSVAAELCLFAHSWYRRQLQANQASMRVPTEAQVRSLHRAEALAQMEAQQQAEVGALDASSRADGHLPVTIHDGPLDAEVILQA